MCDILEEKKENIESAGSEDIIDDRGSEGVPGESPGEAAETKAGETGAATEPGIPESPADDPVLSRGQAIGTLLEQSFRQLENKIEASDNREASIRVSGEVKTLLQSFYKKVADRLEDRKGVYAYKLQASFIKGLIGIYDLLKELENAWYREEESIHAKNYKTILTQLLQVFIMHDIIPVSPGPGEVFNPLYHRVAGIEDVSVPAEDETISECTRTGFAFQEVVIRPAEIKIKKYREKPGVDGEEEPGLPETDLEQKEEENNLQNKITGGKP